MFDGSIYSSVVQYFDEWEQVLPADAREALRPIAERARRINNGAVAKKDLKHGAYYEGRCRNATVARWDAQAVHFVHWRTKFGDRFTETIRHPDDEHHYDVFKPDREINAPSEEIPLDI